MAGPARRLATLAARPGTFALPLALLERVDGGQPGLLRVLTYHRVDEPGARPDLYPGLISATPAEFDRQMRHVAARYRAMSLPEVLECLRTGRPVPPRAVLVTFDDAYSDFAEHAWPALKRHGIPGTLFVPTAYPDQPERAFWWDRLYQAVMCCVGRTTLGTPLGQLPVMARSQRLGAFERLTSYLKMLPHDDALAEVERVCRVVSAAPARNAVLGWDALRALARDGVTLGAHTRTHPLLRRIAVGQARDEVLGSLQDLEREVGPTARVLAYPAGDYSDAVVDMLRQEGIEMAFTTDCGIDNILAADRLRLRRIYVGERTILPILRAQLLPCSMRLQRRGPAMAR